MSHYLPLTDLDREEMLREIGAKSLEDFLTGMPKSLRNPSIRLPEALSEIELQTLLAKIGNKNQHSFSRLSFLGGGSYDHFIPAAVSTVLGRSEFSTAYTPYQPEASQGTLQAIFEFQSLICELMDMEVSNASHYDGSTSLAEAALMACRHTGRTKILVARSVHPHYRKVLSTYLEGSEFAIKEIPFSESGNLDKQTLWNEMDKNVAGVIIQTPNFLGVAENLSGMAEQIHAAGALLILSANPLSLGALKPPGQWGADIAVGEGQGLGIPMHMGGPYLGIFSTTRALMRKMPGRVAGITSDADGKRAYCLTLQAREQHIRREKAYSSICTNQALCALAACTYMTLLGKSGLKEVSELNMDRAYYLREKIAAVRDFQADTHQTIFNEFVVRTEKDIKSVLTKMEEHQIFAGIPLSSYYPELDHHFLVCATETKTKEDLDRYAEALAQC